MSDHAEEQTKSAEALFDFDSYPADALIHDRRATGERRRVARPESATTTTDGERRQRVERRRRVDPTTFEKQYADDELEFMNAMQRYKVQTGKTFPSYGEVLRVAEQLGYRRVAREG